MNFFSRDRDAQDLRRHVNKLQITTLYPKAEINNQCCWQTVVFFWRLQEFPEDYKNFAKTASLLQFEQSNKFILQVR